MLLTQGSLTSSGWPWEVEVSATSYHLHFPVKAISSSFLPLSGFHFLQLLFSIIFLYVCFHIHILRGEHLISLATWSSNHIYILSFSLFSTWNLNIVGWRIFVKINYYILLTNNFKSKLSIIHRLDITSFNNLFKSHLIIDFIKLKYA